jgi:hypothetical protein
MKREVFLLGLVIVLVACTTLLTTCNLRLKKELQQYGYKPETELQPKHDTIWQDTGNVVYRDRFYKVFVHDTIQGVHDTILANLSSEYNLTDSVETDFVKAIYTAEGYGFLNSMHFAFKPKIKYVIDSIPYPVSMPCAEKPFSIGLSAGLFSDNKFITGVDVTFKSRWGINLQAMPFNKVWVAGVRCKIY